MPTVITGSGGVSKCDTDSVSTNDIQNGAVTPAKTQMGALPSLVRMHTSNGYGSTNTCILRFTNVVTNQGTDITYTDSATLGASFTINTNGVYAISGVYQNSGGAGHFGISLNSTQLSTGCAAINSADRLAAASCGASNSLDLAPACTVFLPAGSVIRPHADGNSTAAAARASFLVQRVA